MNTKRLANPGCYATGFIALVYPLIAGGIAPTDYPFTCTGVSGYSGAGKPMIAKYEDNAREDYYKSPRQYALGLAHKHLPEMQKLTGISHPPHFSPVICDYYAGMTVTVPLISRLLTKPMGADELQNYYAEYYSGRQAVKVMEFGAESANEGAMIDANGIADLDVMEIYICGNDEQISLIARLDNLGKGASGAAIQNMNLMCGFDEMEGLSR